MPSRLRSGRTFGEITDSTMTTPSNTDLQALIATLQAKVTSLEVNVPARPTSTVTFQANPFSGNINPSMSSGLKLFTAATTERKESKKLSAKITNNIKFVESMRDDAASFGWGSLIDTVGASNLHILQDFKEVNLEKVRLHMNTIFHKREADPDATTLPGLILPLAFDINPASTATDVPIFYQRQRANMIGLRILRSLSDSSLSSLKLKENLYLWKTSAGEVLYDGVTMLQVLIDIVKPSLRAGVADLKEKLRHSKLATFGYDVTKMTDKMESTYKEILTQGQTHEDYILDLFRALLTGKNEIFHRFIQDKEGEYETGLDLTPEVLTQLATTRYNNMVAKSKWKSGESKDAKIVALTTKLDNLEKKYNKKDHKTSGQSKNDTSKGSSRYDIPEWRLKKTLGSSVERDGKTFHWCTKQHNKGKGMYVTHKEEDHVDWQEKKKLSGSDSSNSSSSSKKQSLSLSDSLKAAMVTKFKCSKEDANKLWSDITKNQSEN